MTARRFDREELFYESAVKYVPSLVRGLITKAEYLYMLNRLDEAKPILAKIARGKGFFKSSTKTRAALLLQQMDRNLDYFAYPQQITEVLFKPNDRTGARNTPLTAEDVRKKIAQSIEDVAAAERILEYRRKREWDGARYVEAHGIERGHIEAKIEQLDDTIKDFEAQIDYLKQKVTSLRSYADTIRRRIHALMQQIERLPPKVKRQLTELLAGLVAVGKASSKLITAIQSANPKWTLIVSAVSGIFAGLNKANSAAQELLRIAHDLKREIREVRSELLLVRREIAEIVHEIRSLEGRKKSADNQIDEQRKILGQLENSWNGRDQAALARLARNAELVHKNVREQMAEGLMASLRYADLLTLKKNALKKMYPGDGVYSAFNELHLRSLSASIYADLEREQRKPNSRIRWTAKTLRAKGNCLEIYRIFAGLKTILAVHEIPSAYRKARVLSAGLKIVMRDNSGAEYTAVSDFSVSNYQSQSFLRNSTTVKYHVAQQSPVISTGDPSEGGRIFANQSPLGFWEVAKVNGAAFESRGGSVERVELIFDLLVPSRNLMAADINNSVSLFREQDFDEFETVSERILSGLKR